MAWGFTASSYANDGAGFSAVNSGGTQTVTLGAAVSSGDRIIVTVSALTNTAGATAPTFTVTDNVNSGSYTQDKTTTFTVLRTNDTRLSVFSLIANASGTPTITVTLSNGGLNNMAGGLQCAAFTGLLTSGQGVDASAAASGSSTSPSSGATSATTAANELVFGAYADAGDGGTISVGSGFTLAGKHDGDTHNWQGMMEYKDSGASGSTPAATCSLSAAFSWAMIAVVYQISGGAAASPVVPPMRTLRGVGV